MRREVLRLDSVSKTVNDVKVLKNISMTIYEGEIVKLFGESGQSKSILVSILGGVQQPDFGKIYVEGREVNLNSPNDCKTVQISIINKKSDLIPNLTVMENLFLGRRDANSRPFLKTKQHLARTLDLFKVLGLNISPNTFVSKLAVEQVQLVQLGKALLDDPKIIVMDHTNILLDKNQVRLFAGVFKELTKRKVGILVIAQNLRDFTEVSDRIYLIKEGNLIGNINKNDFKKDKIIKIITEDCLIKRSGISLNEISKEVLRVENLSTKDALKNISFTLRKGEILSITGSYGSGKCDIGYALFGIEKITGGKVFIEDKRIKLIKLYY